MLIQQPSDDLAGVVIIIIYPVQLFDLFNQLLLIHLPDHPVYQIAVIDILIQQLIDCLVLI